jgi:hypothetical protein
MQRAFFARQGIGAWARGVVPSYITSNPFIARAYARVVLGYLRDLATGLDTTQPVYIIELGAGSGRFAYHFLQSLISSLSQSALKDLSILYVMTDFAERTLDTWQRHPWLKVLAARGHLDFALYDAEQPGSLCLRQSGTTLSPRHDRQSYHRPRQLCLRQHPPGCLHHCRGQASREPGDHYRPA